MEQLSALLVKRKRAARPAPHAKAAAVNEIVAFLKDDKYGYGYWLRTVGKTSYGDVMAILKKAGELPTKYSRGGYITNRLRDAASSTKCLAPQI